MMILCKSMKWIFVFTIFAAFAMCATKPHIKPVETLPSGQEMKDLIGEWTFASYYNCSFIQENGYLIINEDGTGKLKVPDISNPRTGDWKGSTGPKGIFDITWKKKEDHFSIKYKCYERTIRVYGFFTSEKDGWDISLKKKWIKAIPRDIKSVDSCSDGTSLNLQIKRLFYLVVTADEAYNSLKLFSGFDKDTYCNAKYEGGNFYMVKIDTTLKNQVKRIDKAGNRLFWSKPQ